MMPSWEENAASAGRRAGKARRDSKGAEAPAAKPAAKSATRANGSEGDTPPIVEGELGSLIGYALRRAQLRVFEDFYAALSIEGITPARFSALTLIDSNPGISQTTLAQTLDIARSGVVTLIDTLEGLDLVSREPIQSDKRAYALHLTRNGRSTLQRIRKQVAIHEARVCARLDAREKRQLLEMLARVGSKG